jgi:hypothetical protein
MAKMKRHRHTEPTSTTDLARWFDHGIEHGATHMIVVYDTFSGEDFPFYVMPDENVREVVAEQKARTMQHVMEVYALHLDKIDQLAEYRAFHYESP